MTDDGNSGQVAFWNSDPGQNWALHADELNTLYDSVTTLLLDEARPAAGEHVLDVGCGAGATAFALADRVGPDGSVLGVDVSRPLLDRAEAAAARVGVGNVRFMLADAQDEPLGDGAFDHVASRFGTMFFSDTIAAFRNLGRSLRPGGRIVFVAWAGPEVNPWFTLPETVAVARLGSVPKGAPDAPGPMAFRDIGHVVEQMQDAGLTDCEGRRVDGPLSHPGGIEAAVGLAVIVGPAARVMREKNGGEEDRAAIAAELRSSFGEFVQGGRLEIPAAFNVFSARRP